MSDKQQDATSTAPQRARRWPLFAALFVVLAAGGGGAAWYFGVAAPEGEREHSEVTAPRGEPIYYTLESNLVVNFRNPGRVRYLQVGIELMTRDRRAVEAVKQHSPVLRNNLVMLLSDQTFESLDGREGKERLRLEALEEVQKLMEALYGSPAIESLYFTTFVMQ